MTESDVEALHHRYDEARRRTGDSSAPMSLEQMKATLRKQAPRIMQEHMAFGVAFDVQIKDGKVVLRAKPIK